MSRWRRHACTLLLLLSADPRAHGQHNYATVYGDVTDVNGAPVPNAHIALTGPFLPRDIFTLSSARGAFLAASLPPGRYSITVTAPGFRTLRYYYLDLRLGSKVQFNARMSLGSVLQTVEVNDSLNGLDTASSHTAAIINASEFDNLARGRGFHSILAMAPGVRHEIKSGAAGVGGLQVDGASGSENTFFIDGVEVSDLMTGALREQNSVPLEFVREVEVKSGGFEAEFGGATGGVISVASRGGSNRFHGEAALQITAAAFNANERGGWQRSPFDANAAEFFRPQKDAYRILYPGLSSGGPILRDRLFFFVSAMPEFERTRRVVMHESQGRREYRQTRTRHHAIQRLDYSPVPQLQLNSSYVWSPAKRLGALPFRDARLPAPDGALGSFGDFIPAQLFSAAASWTPNSRLVLNVRYGYKYLNAKSGNYGVADAPALFYRTSSASVEGAPESISAPAGFQSATGAYRITRDITTRNSVHADLSRVSVVLGQQHIFKAGYSLNRLHNNVLAGYPKGRFELFWGDAFSRAGFDQERGRYGYYTWEDGPGLNAQVTGRNHGLYVQDTWTVRRGVTLNTGLRIENEFVPPYRSHVGGIAVANPVSFGWGEKIAPRLGAAWDVRGDGRWKLSGSYGLFYDIMKYALARAAFGGERWITHVYRLDGLNLGDLSVLNPSAAGARITSFDNRSTPINERGELQGIDPDLKPYTAREATISLDSRVSSRFELGVRYTRKDLLRAIEDVGILDASGSEVYLIANPGFGATRDAASLYSARAPGGKEFLVPRATRRYDGLELRMQAQTNRTHVLASYTLSRLWGNYAGLANSDEAGRSDPGISRSYDLPTYYFDSTGSGEAVYGRLATDRPHAFKVFGWHDLRTPLGRSTIGLTQLAMSGSLDSTTVNYQTAPTHPYGRGDLGRLPFYTQTDVNFSHTINVRERIGIKVEANVSNLLNQAAVISRVTHLSRQGNITAQQLPLDRFFSGYKVSDYVYPGSSGPAWNPLYGLPGADPTEGGYLLKSSRSDPSSAFTATNPGFGAYQGGRTLRLGLRLIF